MGFNHGIHRIHGMIVSLVLLFGVAVSAVAAEPGITVEARQRYPWNGLVDFKFTITGESGTKYDTSFTAKDMVGGTNIAMKTIRKSNGVAAEEKEKLLPGTYNWVWDAAADLPDGFKCDRMTVTGTAEQSQGLYMVIDLSSGANSSKYPVSYLDAVPSGGWSDTYKKTKLVLRRIEPGVFKMGGSYNVTLTKVYYIGIFEMTQHQWILVRGNNPVNDYKGDMRPVHEVSYDMIRGSSNGSKWPSSNSVDSGSFMGRMRSRTGLLFDLPTEAQWEYACRAGTTSKYNNGGNGTGDLTKLGRWHDNCDDGKGGISYNVQPTIVGLYQSNAWGLYDMHGNTWECCLDYFGDLSSGVDPKGPLSGMIVDTLGNSYRVLRGGYFLGDAIECTSSYRTSFNPHSAGVNYYYYYGFRVAVTLEE